VRSAHEVIEKVEDYSNRCAAVCEAVGRSRQLRVLCADAERIPRILEKQMRCISLVLTSPPYPGIHVLYHRWQFRGRKEIDLPYAVAGLRNGAFESHYSLGPRGEVGHGTYFMRLRRVFASLNEALCPGTVVAQVVAFSSPRAQLPRYLDEMRAAGFVQMKPSAGKQAFVARHVPNRRWYIRTGSTTSQMREYVLLHRSTGSAAPDP